MSYKIEIKPSGHEFQTEGDETILDAGLRNGFAMTYGCRGGACGSCKGKVLSGEVSYDNDPISLSESDRERGTAVFCMARPRSDLVIEVKEIGAAKDIAVKTLPCRAAKMDKLADDVMRVMLKLPATERLQFLAGQYVDILLRDGRRRSFSLANAPHDDELLELHIRKIEGGSFTTHVFEEMQEKALLRIEGPLGNFFLREDSKRPLIFMAGGTGFAPVKAIVEHAIAENCKRPIYIYWGVRNLASLYLAQLPELWAREYDNIHFVPVLSEPESNDNWSGRTGFVHEAIAADFDNMSGYDVYACGPPVMIEAGLKAFEEKGLPEDQFYSDAFNFAGD